MSTVSHWNYRLTVRAIDGEPEYAIREVYYGPGETVVGWTLEPVGIVSDTREDIEADLMRMADACGMPVLDLDATLDAMEDQTAAQRTRDHYEKPWMPPIDLRAAVLREND